MPTYVLLACCIMMISFGCKSGVNAVSCDVTPPAGRYINTTVLEKCPKVLPADIPHFCFEFNFRGNDSVDVDNGFEKFSLPFSKEQDGCRFKIAGASLFGDMYFTIQPDSSLQLIDTAWTKLTTFSTFKNIKSQDGTDLRFEYALNDCAIAGEYALFTKGELAPHAITFYPNGQINGFKPYLGYALCYAGDCLEETDPYAQTIDLLDERGGVVTFAMKSVEGKMAIELYSIGDPVPDQKGGRSIGPMIYELRTE